MKCVTASLVALAIALLAMPVADAKVKINIQRDKAFNFKTLRTYAWHPDGAGDVKILLGTGEDPKPLQASLEPVIREAVEKGLAERGLTPAPSDTADLHVNYYVIVGGAMTAQTMGQFVGAVPAYGLPPLVGATQSLDIYEQGSLILDLAARTEKSVVWRGTARTEVDRTRDEAARSQRVRQAIGDMLRKLPVK